MKSFFAAAAIFAVAIAAETAEETPAVEGPVKTTWSAGASAVTNNVNKASASGSYWTVAGLLGQHTFYFSATTKTDETVQVANTYLFTTISIQKPAAEAAPAARMLAEEAAAAEATPAVDSAFDTFVCGQKAPAASVTQAEPLKADALTMKAFMVALPESITATGNKNYNDFTATARAADVKTGSWMSAEDSMYTYTGEANKKVFTTMDSVKRTFLGNADTFAIKGLDKLVGKVGIVAYPAALNTSGQTSQYRWSESTFDIVVLDSAATLAAGAAVFAAALAF